VACPGFILAGAEKNIRKGRKKSGGAESHLKGANKISTPTTKFLPSPAEFYPWGQKEKE